MPIEDFEGDTFVAYMDIAGFKEMMKDGNRAWRALDSFYNSGYRNLAEQNFNCKVNGIFVSDCGIIFARNGNSVSQLKSVLEIARQINRELLRKGIMLTTSISYGRFKYQDRIEIQGVRKEAVYGDAYVQAFLDNEAGRPKIKPGQCRIIKKNLPEEVERAINREDTGRQYRRPDDEIFQLIRKRKRDKSHYYFYWNCQNPLEIEIFERNYANAEKLMFESYLKALKGEFWMH